MYIFTDVCLLDGVYFSYIVAVSLIGGGNSEDPEKTTNLSQDTHKLIT